MFDSNSALAIMVCILATPTCSQETTSAQTVCDPSLCDPNNPPKGNFCSMDPIIGCGLFCYDPIICSSLTVPIPITKTAAQLLLSDDDPTAAVNLRETTKVPSDQHDPRTTSVAKSQTQYKTLVPSTPSPADPPANLPGTTTGTVIQLTPLSSQPFSVTVIRPLLALHFAFF